MTQKAAGGKGNEVLRALTDFVILVILLVGTGFGGYWWGTQQQLAPITKVPPGTPGALPATAASKTTTSTTTSAGTTTPATSATSTTPAAGKRKFWISSSGTDQIGQSITVKINDTPVDNFFGPGKLLDITEKVKRGDNKIVFESKSLGESYNTHKGEADATLSVKLNAGNKIEETPKASDVILTYKRAATDSEDAIETMHFSGE